MRATTYIIVFPPNIDDFTFWLYFHVLPSFIGVQLFVPLLSFNVFMYEGLQFWKSMFQLSMFFEYIVFMFLYLVFPNFCDLKSVYPTSGDGFDNVFPVVLLIVQVLFSW